MFNHVMRMLRALKNDRKGVSALEYGILAAVVGGGLAVAVPIYMTGLSTLFGNIGNAAVHMPIGPF